MKNCSKIDRPFFEKFNNSVFFKDINELHNSISTEIANILSANIRMKGKIPSLSTTDANPYAYGTRDLQSLLDASEVRNEFIKHCKQQILALEPRIKNCEISNTSLDYIRQFVRFKLSYTIKNTEDIFTTTIILKT